MVDEVMTNPLWSLTGQAGCCGMGTIFRLKGRDCTHSQRDAALAAWYESENPKALGSDLADWTERTMQQIMCSVVRRPKAKPFGASGPGGYESSIPNWHGAAVTADWGFAALCEAMMNGPQKYALYTMSDNMGTTGDVHNGSFSTKNFVRFLRDNEAGQFQASGPLESLRTQRMIQAWLFTPGWSRIAELVATARKELIDYYKELNNDKRIKGPEQDRLRKRAKAGTTLTTGFSDSTEWRTITLGDPTILFSTS